jgi:hypothetical protein
VCDLCKSLEELGVDKNMRKLVGLMTLLPGLTPISSCGGHNKPKGSQVPKGEFFVAFEVDVLQGGWRSLELITAAIGHPVLKEGLCVTAWSGPGLLFELSGWNGVKPDDFADVLGEAFDEYETAAPPWWEQDAEEELMGAEGDGQ